MRTSTTQRAVQQEDLTLRMRRPPEEYVSLLSQNEQEFRNYVHSFEDNPLFQNLVNEGVVHRVRLRGKIPRQKYEEFMDEQLLDFLRAYNIVEQEGWEKDFLSPNALNRVQELSTKYNVPPGILLRQLRYLRSSDRGSLPQRARAAISESPEEARSSQDRAESAPSGDMIDLTDIIETTREFVDRYEVSEQEFLDLVLSGEATADTLSERFGCSLREAEDLLEATDRVYLASTYEEQGAPQRSKRAKTGGSSGADEPVAFVQVIDDQLSIQFEHDSIYTQRYRIKREGGETHLPPQLRDLLTRARFINQRLSALSRLITTLCNAQLEYLKTGDTRQLKPLAQAQLARQLGEHPSTVSRLIRGKYIETPWGKIPLLFLCQSKTDVVARLIAEFPGLTDQEVVSRLREEYDCYIARRTVAYHRGKRVRRNRRHKNNNGEATAPVTPRSSVAARAQSPFPGRRRPIGPVLPRNASEENASNGSPIKGTQNGGPATNGRSTNGQARRS